MSTDSPDGRPSQFPVWTADEDDDGATRIEAFDPAKLEALAAAAAAAPVPADAESPFDSGARSLRADTILPVEIDEPPAASDALQASIERIGMDLEPLPASGFDFQGEIARIGMDLEPIDAPGSPEGSAPPSDAPAAAIGGPAFGRAPSMFDLGPEPTQIGARPLISFGDTSPLTALVGERPHASMRGVPATQATFLPETKPPLHKDRRVQLAAALLVVILVVILVVVL